MTYTNLSQIKSESAWKARDLIQDEKRWVYELTEHDKQEIETALLLALERNTPLLEFSANEFPLPNFSSALKRAAQECEFGRGVFIIRGIPVAGKSEKEARIIAWGIGIHLGVPLVQNSNYDLIVDVRDKGVDSNISLRGNSSNSSIDFHVDNADIVTLLCWKNGFTGGISRVASSVTIHNEMAINFPHHLSELYTPLPFIDLSKKNDDHNNFFMSPIFGFEKAIFASRYYRVRNLAARDIAAAPKLTAKQIEAINIFHDIASDSDVYIEMQLQPGDLQMLNSHVTCHARTAFVDGEQEEQKRHLFRQWIATPNSRPLPLAFEQSYGNVKPGVVRGGYRGWLASEEIITFQRNLSLETGMKFEHD